MLKNPLLILLCSLVIFLSACSKNVEVYTSKPLHFLTDPLQKKMQFSLVFNNESVDVVWFIDELQVKHRWHGSYKKSTDNTLTITWLETTPNKQPDWHLNMIQKSSNVMIFTLAGVTYTLYPDFDFSRIEAYRDI